MTGIPILRLAGSADANALLRLKQQLDRESDFMLLEPDERDPSAMALAEHLAELSASQHSVVIVAEVAGELAGYVELSGGEFRRNRSTAYLVIGVLASMSGKGVGTSLLREARQWASARGIHRIELTVMAHNQRAIALYQRSGFAVEGTRRECLRVNGTFVDELYMAHLLPIPADVPARAR